jgi:transposase InsO family protein
LDGALVGDLDDLGSLVTTADDAQGARRRVGVGSRVCWDGDRVWVVELSGTTALLRDSRGGYTSVALLDLLTAQPSPARTGGDAAANAGGDDEFYADLLAVDDDGDATERARHVREMLTGYCSGSADAAAEGEPRPEYDPRRSKGSRYEAKAAELGVGVSTVRGWAACYAAAGEAGLVDGRKTRMRPVLAGLDTRWVAMARAVIDEHTDASTPTKKIILVRVAARLERDHGPGVVPLPGRTRGYEALGELSRGRNAFTGSAKARRSIAARPAGTYGRLQATRPGEYVLADTTPLDVFAMEPVTLRWVRLELSIAMDLYTRAILALALTPISTTSVDIAGLIFETIRPPERPARWPGQAAWPYHGLPGTIVVDAEGSDGVWEVTHPPVLPETLLVDRGRVYVSAHVESACARLGVSIALARPLSPTDKAPIERYFRTVREGLLEALPGYKGPDVHSRGQRPEAEAFFFIDELEDLLREWTARVYHHSSHEGLCDPHAPGVELSPVEMFGHGVARAGYLEVPEDPDLAMLLLPVAWRRINHYGIEIHGLRYNGPGLNPYRSCRSPYAEHDGRWPVHYHPEDIRRVYFRDPDPTAETRWHALSWDHADELDAPFSTEALEFARRLASAGEDRHVEPARALASLLAEWNVGLAQTPGERRIALRLARRRARSVDGDGDPAGPGAGRSGNVETQRVTDTDDTLQEGDAEAGEAPAAVGDRDPPAGPVDLAAFYADALEDA